MNIDIESLGLTVGDIQNRVIERLVERIMGDCCAEDYAERFRSRVVEDIRKHVDKCIAATAESQLLPNITKFIETMVLTPTNRWGEPQPSQPKQTFTEFLVAHTEAWISEMVDFNGKAQNEDVYQWRGTQTQIAAMIHQHLHFSIERVVQQALKDANSVLAKGIADTCKTKLEECLGALKINVQTKA